MVLIKLIGNRIYSIMLTKYHGRIKVFGAIQWIPPRSPTLLFPLIVPCSHFVVPSITVAENVEIAKARRWLLTHIIMCNSLRYSVKVGLVKQQRSFCYVTRSCAISVLTTVTFTIELIAKRRRVSCHYECDYSTNTLVYSAIHCIEMMQYCIWLITRSHIVSV